MESEDSSSEEEEKEEEKKEEKDGENGEQKEKKKGRLIKYSIVMWYKTAWKLNSLIWSTNLWHILIQWVVLRQPVFNPLKSA